MSLSRNLILVTLVLFLFPAAAMGGGSSEPPVHNIEISESNGIYICKLSVSDAGLKTGYLIEKFPADVTLVSSSLPEESLSVKGDTIFIALTGEESFDFIVGMQDKPEGKVEVEWKDLVDGRSGTFSYLMDGSEAAAVTGTGDSGAGADKSGKTAAAAGTRASPGFGIFTAVISCMASAAALSHGGRGR